MIEDFRLQIDDITRAFKFKITTWQSEAKSPYLQPSIISRQFFFI